MTTIDSKQICHHGELPVGCTWHGMTLCKLSYISLQWNRGALMEFQSLFHNYQVVPCVLSKSCGNCKEPQTNGNLSLKTDTTL